MAKSNKNSAKLNLVFDKEEKAIIEQLKREPMEVDSLARALGVSVVKIGATLSLMQLKGLIQQEENKYYVN
jgi:predicted Rossmann fold nucleotide-binding protein DprA/Smf involved in DNA uptake